MTAQGWPATPIFHVAFVADWERARAIGTYRTSTRGADLDRVGFIHCSYRAQVGAILRLHYGDVEEPLTVLVIDVDRVTAEVRVENLEGGDDLFPHLYGPLPVAAVVDTVPVVRVDGEPVAQFPD